MGFGVFLIEENDCHGMALPSALNLTDAGGGIPYQTALTMIWWMFLFTFVSFVYVNSEWRPIYCISGQS